MENKQELGLVLPENWRELKLCFVEREFAWFATCKPTELFTELGLRLDEAPVPEEWTTESGVPFYALVKVVIEGDWFDATSFAVVPTLRDLYNGQRPMLINDCDNDDVLWAGDDILSVIESINCSGGRVYVEVIAGDDKELFAV